MLSLQSPPSIGAMDSPSASLQPLEQAVFAVFGKEFKKAGGEDRRLSYPLRPRPAAPRHKWRRYYIAYFVLHSIWLRCCLHRDRHWQHWLQHHAPSLNAVCTFSSKIRRDSSNIRRDSSKIRRDSSRSIVMSDIADSIRLELHWV